MLKAKAFLRGTSTGKAGGFRNQQDGRPSFGDGHSVFMGLFLLLVLLSTLVHIVLRTAENIAMSTCDKDLMTVFA